MPAKPGRPKGDPQTRAALVNAARACFLHNAYERVSIRELARRAKVDAAMIRYYFGSKAGLFETMVRETIAPVAQILKHNLSCELHSPEELMQAYYQMMAANPALPRLIFQVLNNQHNNEVFSILAGVFSEMLGNASGWVQQLAARGQLNPTLEPQLVRLSFLSLMVFPLIAPKLLMQEFDFELTDKWLTKLLNHNRIVMREGLFNSDNLPPSELGVNHELQK
ncbi:TetR/AcrR family transcriptional regulator [Shewanella dokdonensis]|uniref:TetR/AcrR family transcriptional regulator n=1 Tax=Shewanella dokdonensis TaxID=712036 RepID=A0ABX8DGG8_9GAMM|nr:TetR/AcrR family transcriptional regulator [Shewanella dokdonensis]MCL1075048.1 TetR/AcrR family transcriptional regulator [Shewanella dokdonensis]QVK23465.1 TetR/AcrR family transcriptional regulator [Shewanella dokdonensis]